MFRKNGEVVLLSIKIVDDILMNGTHGTLRNLVNKFVAKFKLAETVHGACVLRLCDLKMTENADYFMQINADNKLNSIKPYPLLRARRRKLEEEANQVECRAAMSINVPIR